MGDFFIVENNVVKPNPQLLLIKEFKDLWDKSQPELSLDRLGFVFFMVSHVKNPFIGYPEQVRGEKIAESLVHGKQIMEKQEQELIQAAINKYTVLREEGSTTIRYYKATIKGAEKMIDFFSTLDMTKQTRGGMPMYKPADITRALKDTSDVLKTLISLKKSVEEEEISKGKTKRDREISKFEKPEKAI